MSRRDKLLARMRDHPGDIRFVEVEALLRHEGFVRSNAVGSHRRYRHADGRTVALVRPHGGRRTCHPDAIRDILEILTP